MIVLHDHQLLLARMDGLFRFQSGRRMQVRRAMEFLRRSFAIKPFARSAAIAHQRLVPVVAQLLALGCDTRRNQTSQFPGALGSEMRVVEKVGIFPIGLRWVR